MVRPASLGAAWLISLASCAAAFAQQFPYVAYVTSPQTYVRSGPGQKYYPTATLTEGFAVEVYRHDDDGWCAVRPPAGSFCWVPEHQVRDLGSGILEVVADGAVARVGSALSPARSAVQVMLPRSERVEALGQTAMDDPRWVRIAPPAGEFRWVAARHLAAQPPLEPQLPDAGRSNWTAQSMQPASGAAPPSSEFAHLTAAEAGGLAGITSNGLQFETPQHAAEAVAIPASYDDPEGVQVVPGSPAQAQLASSPFPNGGALPPPLMQQNSVAGALPIPANQNAVQPVAQPSVPSPTRVRLPGLTAQLSERATSVEEVELRLSQTVVGPPTQWQLESLYTDAANLLESETDPAARAQLREVLGRIDRFQEVRRRYQQLPPELRDNAFASQEPEAEVSEAPAGPTGLSSDVRDRAKTDLAGGPLYDAAGVLKPVVSQREQAPQYALVDDRGEVVSFVTPTPDLNLQPFLGQRIGVHGTRNFMPEYRRAHVTAGRVTPIEATLRR